MNRASVDQLDWLEYTSGADRAMTNECAESTAEDEERVWI